MPTYLTPGVYYERVDASAPAIGIVRMDIAGFVGIAGRGPVDTPVPVESFRQFVAHFGNFTGAGFLAYAVRGFFENWGRRCWIVRVASDDPAGGYRSAAVELNGTISLAPFWRVTASSPGVWGNNLEVEWQLTHAAQTVADAGASTVNYSTVHSVSRFSRGTLTMLSQPGVRILRVVSDVDGPARRLIWMNDDPERRLVYDTPLAGLDPGLPIAIESVEYTLIVRELGRLLAVYSNLNLIPEDENYGPARLGPLEIPAESEQARKLPPAPEPVRIEELRRDYLDLSVSRPLDMLLLPSGPVELAGGQDGLQGLTTYDFIGEPVEPTDADVIRALKMRGFRRLDLVQEVTSIAIPDIHIQPVAPPPAQPKPPCVPDPCLPTTFLPPAAVPPPAVGELPQVFSDDDIHRVQAALIDYCELRSDRIAILSPPVSASRDDALGTGATLAWRNRFDSKYAAFYYPWIRVVDPLRRPGVLTRDIPACGFVAGQFARTDAETGVHRAPANEPLNWVQDVTVQVNEARHGILNPLGINLLRSLPSRGIRIMGARTLSSDPDWRYLNVRRLLIMIEKAILIATQWAVFEPNDHLTRSKLRLSLQGLLIALFQRGALVGANIREAFFVICDESNNPPAERANGRLVAEVGVAPSVPFEFVVLRVGRTRDEFEIEEVQARRN